MTGQIPPYARDYGFALQSHHYPYTPGMASRRYVLKGNEDYYVRGDNTGHGWFTYGPGMDEAVRHLTLTKAMNAILDVIYPATGKSQS